MDKHEIKQKIKGVVENNNLVSDITKLSLFGSYLVGLEKKNSDVDLLIEFNPSAKVGFFRLIEIQEILSKSIGKKIDLLTSASLSKYFKDEIINQAETIYERQ